MNALTKTQTVNAIDKAFTKELAIKSLFETYMSTNIQIGIADIFELESLKLGRDMVSRRTSAQVGTKTGFDLEGFVTALSNIAPNDIRVVTHRLENNVKESTDASVIYVYYYRYHDVPDGEVVFDADRDDTEMVGMSLIHLFNKSTKVASISNREYADAIQAVVGEWVKDDLHDVEIASMGKEGIKTVTRTLDKKKVERALDEFYPFIKGGVVNYIDRFLKSTSGILLFIGDPGTAKSTLIREIILQSEKPATMTFDPNAIKSVDLLDHFYSSDSTLLVLEDADAFIGSREGGNEHLSAYLNYAQGVVQYPDKKIIISTNLSSLKKVDEALYRSGRCYDIVTFRHLTHAEAMLVRPALGLEPKELNGTTFTIAEILDKNPETGDTVREAPKIGFGG